MAFLLIASFFITSIIFNYINFVNCWLSDVYVPFFIADKLYYVRTNTIFYIDLVGVSLDNNTIVYASNWVNINVSKLNIDYLPKDSFLGGKANDKIFFVSNHSKELRLHAFDATLKKLEANISYQGVLNAYYNFDEINWISDEQTSKSYIYDTYVGGDANLTIFDSNNLAWINGTSNPQNLLQGILGSSQIIVSYHSFVQVLSASDKIFYIGGRISGSSFTIQFMPMKNILIYDIVSDSWLINNATGNEIEGRTGHTAVMTTDKRIIVYGGLNKLRPALPYLAVLDTSNIPYEWSAPTEENSIGPITEHSSIMIKNYMITAFGRNLSERDDAKYDIKDVYKLNISNPLSYKWSLLATPNNQSNSVDNNSSIFDSINTKTDGVSVRWIVTIIVIVTAVIFLLILIIHKIIQRKQVFNQTP